MAAESPWRRVAVVGNSGAGKTTFSERWAERTGARRLEIDELHWEANWTPVDDRVLRERLRSALEPNHWIIAGNYAQTRDIVWRRATAVVWLDLPLATCFTRTLNRSLARCWSGEVLWNGNRETWQNTFLSIDSILLYLLRTHQGRRRETERDLALPEHQHLEVRRLKKPSQVRSFLAEVA